MCIRDRPDAEGNVQLKSGVTNSIYTDVSFRKEWEGQNGSTVDDTYLSLDLTVTFKLQVRAKDVEGATWQWASEYFKIYRCV